MTSGTALELSTNCCVVGGGPAGIMLGFLLARAGIDVVVLEKHADFLRDFRGDTVHPSTLELMYELGLLEKLLQRPHQQVSQLGAQIGKEFVMVADFSKVPTHAKFIAFMPQWDFLNFMVEEAKRFKTFRLELNAEATDLIEESGRVVGIKAKTASGEMHVRAKLVVGADGRKSVIRERAGFEVFDAGAPMDVLWFRMSRKESDPSQTLGRVDAGVIFIMLNRGEYWQCGFVIAKGKLDDLKLEGLDAFRQKIIAIAPFLADRVHEIDTWDDVKLLTVKVDRLTKWHREGLLCIGDAAHAMSPIGGVGINLAVQDAVATANLLWKPLLDGTCGDVDLQKVQERRTYPTRMTQRLQIFLQNNFVRRALESQKPMSPPFVMRLLKSFPDLRAIPAKVLGIGFRPEHIHTPLDTASVVAKNQ